MFEISLEFHDRHKECPKEPGCYLVVVKEDPEVMLPESELDSLVITLGGTYYSIAHWDGEDWDEIYLDNMIISVPENRTFHILMWTDREYSLPED